MEQCPANFLFVGLCAGTDPRGEEFERCACFSNRSGRAFKHHAAARAVGAQFVLTPCLFKQSQIAMAGATQVAQQILVVNDHEIPHADALPRAQAGEPARCAIVSPRREFWLAETMRSGRMVPGA